MAGWIQEPGARNQERAYGDTAHNISRESPGFGIQHLASA